MVNIFTRKITDELTSLVKQMDAVVGKNKSERMASFVVLLTDDPDEGEEQLAAFAKKHKIHLQRVNIEGLLIRNSRFYPVK